jgi:PAS domain S-box-containing protein
MAESRPNDATTEPNVRTGVDVDAIPDAVLVADADTGRIVDANAAAGDLFHCESGDLVGRHRSALHPTADGDYARAFERAAESERVNRFENGDPIYVETADGTQRPVEINARRHEAGDGVFVVGVFRLASDQLARERKLEETTSQLETLLEALPLPVTVLNPNGTVDRWNRAAEETFGYPAESVVGAPFPLFIEDEEFGEVFTRILDGGVLDGYETVYRSRDGSRVEVEVYARPLYENGALTGVVGTVVDISERTRRMQQLEVLHRALRHNLRNQLTVVRGRAEQIATAEAADAATDSEAAARKIVRSSERFIGLCEQAGQIRKSLDAELRERRAVGVESVVTAVSDVVGERLPTSSLTVSEYPEGVAVPGPTELAVRRLLRRVCEHVDDPSLRVAVQTHRRHVVISLSADEQLLPDGDRPLINEGRETALEHGNDLAVAHAALMLQSVGGDLSMTETDASNALLVEVPQTTVGE